jgi:hypothetical protein
MSGTCNSAMPDATDNSGPIPIEMLADTQFKALCDYLVRCQVFEDGATCRSALGAQISTPNLIEAVKAGKVRYDGAKARQCVDAVAANTCERARAFSFRDAPQVCNEVFTGTIAGSAACFLNEECVSGICNIPSCNMACCPGTCAGNTPPGRPAIGQPCTSRDHCVDGYCPSSPNAMCTAYKPLGLQCANSDECMPGLSCLPGSADPAMMFCRAPMPTLGACSVTAECATLADTCRAGKCQTGGLTGTVCMGADQCQLQHVVMARRKACVSSCRPSASPVASTRRVATVTATRMACASQS